MRYISFRYAVNGPTKPQKALSNHEAEYFRQSQASLFWPITATAIAYKKALAGNFGHQPKHSTSLQLACLVERVSRNLGEKRLTGAVVLDVAKAFDTVWVDGLAYKLMALNFPSYLVKTIQSYLQSRTFEASFQAATSSRRGTGGIDLSCPLQPVCQ
jgi:hypothetical protein